MNRPPVEYVVAEASALREFVATAFERASAPPDRAAFLSDILVTNDLRGVFSHGTRMTPHYVHQFQAGELNPAPEIEVISETPTTVIVDGDGGLGYFPAHRAATILGPKALEAGLAAAVTRNHGHFGAAGIYSRVLVQQDLFGYVTSGHQLHLEPGKNVLQAGGGSPMSFALPTGEEPPFVLDFGAMHDLYGAMEQVQQIVELAPSTVFRSFGLGCVCQALGGFLTGVPVDPARAQRQWPGANQGSFMIAVDLKRFLPLDQFKREMDEYSRKVRQMKPLSGFDQAALAGTPEWERERRYAVEGIPLSLQNAEALRKLAADFGLEAPL